MRRSGCTPFEKCLSILFWNLQTAALAVSLTLAQSDFFNACGTRPHISLAKPTHWHWQGVGEFVATCQKETDWTVLPADLNLMFSKRLSA